jgi:protein TonB
MRDPEILAQCLVEGDAARVGRFRRLRRKALLLSAGVEAMLLAALLLAPLATPSTLSRRLDWTPMPPFGRSPRAAKPAPHPHNDPVRRPPPQNVRLFQQPYIPTSAPRANDPAADEIVSTLGVESGEKGAGDPNGVPFGTDSPIRIPAPGPVKPPDQHPRVLHLSHLDAALLDHRVMPVYPPLAVQARQEGEVKMHAIIATDGSIKSLEVVSGGLLFIQAARDAGLQWRYKPTLLNGQPVEVDSYITVIFRLDRSERSDN